VVHAVRQMDYFPNCMLISCTSCKKHTKCRWDFTAQCVQYVLDCIWNVMAHGDTREGKWRGNRRMEWVASSLHTTSELVWQTTYFSGSHRCVTGNVKVCHKVLGEKKYYKRLVYKLYTVTLRREMLQPLIPELLLAPVLFCTHEAVIQQSVEVC
jgi:hypothetical protein